MLDLTCGIAVTNVGHAHPRVVRAVSEQAAKLMHISTGVATYESNIALAEALGTVTPRGLDTVFFGNSGATRWRPWGVPHVLLQPPSLNAADISVDEAYAGYERLLGSSRPSSIPA